MQVVNYSAGYLMYNYEDETGADARAIATALAGGMVVVAASRQFVGTGRGVCRGAGIRAGGDRSGSDRESALVLVFGEFRLVGCLLRHSSRTKSWDF